MELNAQAVQAKPPPAPTPTQLLLRPVLWVGTFSVLLRQLMHLALPPLPSLAWEYWLSVTLVGTFYEQSVQQRDALWLNALCSQLYAVPVVGLLYLMFPQAQEGFWVSLLVMPLGVLVGSAVAQFYETLKPGLFGRMHASEYNGQSRYPPGGTVQQFVTPPSAVIVTPDEAGLMG